MRNTLRNITIILVVGVLTFMAIGAVANAADCPTGTTKTPYGGPDNLGVHLTQPNIPAFYVELHAPDGTVYTPTIGQYTNSVSGQWYVCYVEDIYVYTAPTLGGDCTEYRNHNGRIPARYDYGYGEEYENGVLVDSFRVSGGVDAGAPSNGGTWDKVWKCKITSTTTSTSSTVTTTTTEAPTTTILASTTTTIIVTTTEPATTTITDPTTTTSSSTSTTDPTSTTTPSSTTSTTTGATTTVPPTTTTLPTELPNTGPTETLLGAAIAALGLLGIGLGLLALYTTKAEDDA